MNLTMNESFAEDDYYFNVDKFKTDRQHNVLYITGLIGSGKTTLAEKLSGKNTSLIRLDFYFDRPLKTNTDITFQCPLFNKWCKKNIPDFKKVWKNFNVYYDAGVLGKGTEEEFITYWKTMDAILTGTKKFAEYVYPTGNIIVEGVQLFDSFVDNDLRKTFYDDQCVIVKGTNAKTAFEISQKRNEAKGLSMDMFAATESRLRSFINDLKSV